LQIVFLAKIEQLFQVRAGHWLFPSSMFGKTSPDAQRSDHFPDILIAAIGFRRYTTISRFCYNNTVTQIPAGTEWLHPLENFVPGKAGRCVVLENIFLCG
jgi:hypothetical protein